jgi:hypothetical protein
MIESERRKRTETKKTKSRWKGEVGQRGSGVGAGWFGKRQEALMWGWSWV